MGVRRALLAALAVGVAAAGCSTAGSENTAHVTRTAPGQATIVSPAGGGATTTPAPPPSRHPRRPLHVAPVPPPVPDPSPAQAIAPGAPSDAQVRQELEQAMGVKGGHSGAQLQDLAELTPDGYAVSPPAAPDAVDAVIRGGNQVAHAPYVYGGGHGTWIDTAYDCSGSVSFALAAAHLLNQTMDSTALEHWGAPGPGRWITVYANAGHAWMVVAGLRFDTSGRASDTASRWQADPRSTAGFVARHPPGL